MEQRTLQWTSFHRICGALHFYFVFFFSSCRWAASSSTVQAVAILLTHSLQVWTLSLLFDCLLLHWTFGICYLLAGECTEEGSGGRAVASITSICFLFKFCIRCQGSWWQGCIKCFCGCKSELMRAEKNGKKSKQRERGKRGRSGGEGRGKKSLRLPAVTRLIYTLAQASQANTTTK